MKQRGRSPVAKPQLPSARLGDSATGSGGPPTGLRAGGSSSKSLTSELLQDFRWDDSSEISAKEESGLMVPAMPSRSLSQTLSPCHSGSGNRPEFIFDDFAGSDSNGSCETDPQLTLTQKAIEQIETKISKTKELIRDEQTSRDNNVNEYLKLSANAERQQQNRIKQVFEKKNQKSAQSILLLQKKLEEYQKKVRELEEHGIHRSSQKIRGLGQGIKSVGGNIRDGISGMSSSVMSKPKELAAHLLKHRSESFDNLTDSSVETVEKLKQKPHQGSASLPREDTSFNEASNSSEQQQHQRERCLSDDGRAQQAVVGRISGVPSESDESVPAFVTGGTTSGGTTSVGFALMTSACSPRHSDHEWKAVVQELSLLKEEVDRLREDIGDLKLHFKQELEVLSYQLRDERDHCDRLEDQIRDLTELHQHEILSIRAGVTDMEEKVQYQSEERLLDIREHLQSLENKLTAVEHQATQQQYLNIEGLDSTDARAIMMKLLTATITVVHVVLFILGTFLSFAKPFVRTSLRVAVTAIVITLSVVIYHKQEALEGLIIKLRNKQMLFSDVGTS